VRQVQRTFDRRTGELNGSLSGSARFTVLLTIMENAQFSPRIGHAGHMGLWQHNRGPAVAELGRAAAWEHFAADSVK